MAQDYAPLYRSIWNDPDFRALDPDSQLLYLMLMSSPDRDEAGLLVLSSRRWARQSAGLTAQRVDDALVRLDDAGFLVVDRDTDEVLVRAHIRRAKVYTHIRLLRIAMTRAGGAESDRIRSALGQELARLPKLAIPERHEKMAEEARLAQSELDVLVSMMCDAPPDPPGADAVDNSPAHPIAHPISHPMAHPPGVGAGAGVGAGVGAVGGFPSSRRNDLQLVDARPRDPCPQHPGQTTRHCSGCRADTIGATA